MSLITESNQDYYDGTSLGSYQFISLETIIDQFLIGYVGEDKLIPRVKRTDVSFHAQRALQEMSFDTFKSTKAVEQEITASLSIPLPQDYVNYVKITTVDSRGIEHVVYPTNKSSKPKHLTQDATGAYSYDENGVQLTDETNSVADANFSSNVPAENTPSDHTHNSGIEFGALGQRYGINPETANINGNFIIDDQRGIISFSSNLVNQTVILKYISDSLGTEDEMQVHKFAEEAMYKQIAYAILSARYNTPEYIVNRFRRDARAAKRNAKLRLSNIKLEEITQVLRGKSKQIKH